MSIYINKKLALLVEGDGEGEGEENILEVHKGQDNYCTSMPSALLIVSYFILPTLPPFWSLEHQFIVQQTPQHLVMPSLSRIMGCL
jgi:hypothetical protein